jgi:Myotubularin-like phosphatase domain
MWADLRIPNRAILHLDRYKHPVVGKVNKDVFAGLNVICRNFRFESFVFPSRKLCKRAFKILARYAFEDDSRASFAFANMESFIGSFNGWKTYPFLLFLFLYSLSFVRYKCSEEFKRFGLNKDWRISDINKKFEFCDIYPKNIIVPTYVS